MDGYVPAQKLASGGGDSLTLASSMLQITPLLPWGNVPPRNLILGVKFGLEGANVLAEKLNSQHKLLVLEALPNLLFWP